MLGNDIGGGFAISDELVSQWWGYFGIKYLWICWGESELCINSWFCVILTHFFLLPVVYIHTERIVCWWGSLLVGGGSVIWVREMRRHLRHRQQVLGEAMPKFCFWPNGEDRMIIYNNQPPGKLYRGKTYITINFYIHIINTYNNRAALLSAAILPPPILPIQPRHLHHPVHPLPLINLIHHHYHHYHHHHLHTTVISTNTAISIYQWLFFFFFFFFFVVVVVVVEVFPSSWETLQQCHH